MPRSLSAAMKAGRSAPGGRRRGKIWQEETAKSASAKGELQAGDGGQSFPVELGEPAAAGVVGVQALELHQAQGGPDFVQAVVIARGDDVVAEAVAPVAVPGKGGHAVGAGGSDAGGQGVVTGDHQTAFAGGQVFIGKEAEAGHGPQGADLVAAGG